MTEDRHITRNADRFLEVTEMGRWTLDASDLVFEKLKRKARMLAPQHDRFLLRLRVEYHNPRPGGGGGPSVWFPVQDGVALADAIKAAVAEVEAEVAKGGTP